MIPAHAHTQGQQDIVPKPMIYALFGLCAFAVIATGLSAVTGIGQQTLPEPTIVESTEIIFEDGADGVVLVKRADTNEVLRSFGTSEGSFVRITARSLARRRLANGGSPREPFILARTATGELILTDPVTSKSLLLRSFGENNMAAFAEFLPEADPIETAVRTGA
ncbi:MAG: photosynthetic complex assembly protein PuhC [Pseudomonadota bacterium]